MKWFKNVWIDPEFNRKRKFLQRVSLFQGISRREFGSLQKEAPWPDELSGQMDSWVGSVEALSESFARNERRDRVNWALAQLKPVEREILEMSRFDELSYTDMAVVLGINSDAVMKRHARALLRLTHLLSETEPSEEP